MRCGLQEAFSPARVKKADNRIRINIRCIPGIRFRRRARHRTRLLNGHNELKNMVIHQGAAGADGRAFGAVSDCVGNCDKSGSSKHLISRTIDETAENTCLYLLHCIIGPETRRIEINSLIQWDVSSGAVFAHFIPDSVKSAAVSAVLGSMQKRANAIEAERTEDVVKFFPGAQPIPVA